MSGRYHNPRAGMPSLMAMLAGVASGGWRPTDPGGTPLMPKRRVRRGNRLKKRGAGAPKYRPSVVVDARHANCYRGTRQYATYGKGGTDSNKERGAA